MKNAKLFMNKNTKMDINLNHKLNISAVLLSRCLRFQFAEILKDFEMLQKKLKNLKWKKVSETDNMERKKEL